MIKRILLSAIFIVSTLATGNQIHLNLDLTISHEENQQHAIGSLDINEGEVTSIVFNGLESFIVDLIAQSQDDMVIMQTQLFQQNENNELLPIADPLAVQVPFDQPATFTIHEAEGTGSLVLIITPSHVNN